VRLVAKCYTKRGQNRLRMRVYPKWSAVHWKWRRRGGDVNQALWSGENFSAAVPFNVELKPQADREPGEGRDRLHGLFFTFLH
jgi:hypothetical protein